MSPFADNMIVCIDNPKEPMKTLELMVRSRFSKVANCKTPLRYQSHFQHVETEIRNEVLL